MVGSNDHTQYSISQIEKSDDSTLKQQTFYKVCEFPEKDLPNQRLIVTFSLKYRDYQRRIRERHIQRALHKLESPSEFDKKRSTDFKRLVKEKMLRIMVNWQKENNTHLMKKKSLQKCYMMVSMLFLLT